MGFVRNWVVCVALVIPIAVNGECEMFSRKILAGLAAVGAVSAGTLHWVDRERRNVGYGIDLQMEDIYDMLNAEEREIFKNPRENARKIVEILTDKLEGDFDTTLAQFKATQVEDFQGRSAAKFFKGQAKRRGVCREKALILTKILGRLGIAAEAKAGEVSELPLRPFHTGGTIGHVWVYIPKLNLVADPTFGIIEDASVYKKTRKVGWEADFFPGFGGGFNNVTVPYDPDH